MPILLWLFAIGRNYDRLTWQLAVLKSQYYKKNIIIIVSKHVKKELRRRLKERAKSYYVHPQTSKTFRLMGVFGAFVLAANIIIISYQIYRNNYIDIYDILFRISVSIFTFCFSAYLYLMGLTPAFEEKNFDLDNWVFYVEFRKRITKLVAAVCVCFLSSFVYFYLGLDKYYSALISFVGSINYLLYNIVILYVIFNPQMILNSMLTGVGSGMKLLSYTLIIEGIRGFIVFYVVENIFLGIIVLVVVGIIIRIIMEYDRQYILLFGRGLDYVQLKVVKIIKPIHLIAVIRKSIKRLEDRQRALDLVQKMRASNDHGLMLEFADLIEKDKKNSFKWLGGFVFFVVAFVLSSMGEGLIQDLLNDRAKEFLCELLRLLCAKK